MCVVYQGKKSREDDDREKRGFSQELVTGLRF